MNKLKLHLNHCYGIKNLDAELDYSRGRTIAIYAPNGSMKSSLAQTFQDVVSGADSKDRVFPERESTRSIVDETGSELKKENLVVIKPYDESYSHDEATSTLLVNADLRKEYEDLHKQINQAKTILLKALKNQSKSRKNLENEVSLSFTRTEDQFFTALLRIYEEVTEKEDAPFSEIHYDQIFDDKVLDFLSSTESKAAIKAYIEKYNELLEASTYFKKGIFNYYNAETIAKNLAQNGFFDARHSVNLNAEKSLKITSVRI